MLRSLKSQAGIGASGYVSLAGAGFGRSKERKLAPLFGYELAKGSSHDRTSRWVKLDYLYDMIPRLDGAQLSDWS